MLSCVLMMAAVPQIGSDAKTFYDAMQKRIAEAIGFRQSYIVYSAPDYHVDVYYDRTGQYSYSGHQSFVYSDGKYGIRYGERYEHFRATPNGIFYVEGMESIYPSHPPLDVFGVIEQAEDPAGRRCWGLRYRSKEGVKSVCIDGKTGLPIGVTLISKGEALEKINVPPFRPQSEVVSEAAALQKAWTSLLIRKTTYVPEGSKNETIWIQRGGKAYVTSSIHPFKQLGYDDKRQIWNGSRKPVRIASLTLPGFEAFLGRPLTKTSGDSKIGSGVESIPGWVTDTHSENWRWIRYDQEKLWPSSATSADRKKNITYQIDVNPTILMP